MEELSLFSVPRPHIYTVSELTEAIRQILETEFPFVWVEGEISNSRCPLSGHFYFTLKDDKAQISAILFKNQRRLLHFEPEDGLKVICQGRITVYPPHGNYRLVVEYLEPKGYGALQLAFEQLKKKLSKEGLFDQAIKKPLPVLPRRIAVITSPVGAAIRDFLRILFKKSQNIHVFIYPVRVQGEGAAKEIAQAIFDLNRLGWAELIVLTRGGGSLEDLWAFNEEIVARAIHASHIPIISAIGHEVDFTISDMVADIRAATPTAAAEMIGKKQEEFGIFLEDIYKRMIQTFKKQLETSKLHIEHFLNRLRRPQLITYRLRLDELTQTLLRLQQHAQERRYTILKNLMERLLLCHPKRQLQKYSEIFSQKEKEIILRYKHLLSRKKQTLREMEQRLNALSPLNVLKRGYALAFSFPEKRLIKSVNQVNLGEKMLIKLADGEIRAKTEEKYDTSF
ncbi:MAG: exodeoxyribonuclease VII large subunit [Candidatus Desulfofervidus auxilii]|nr:exodeoxyribonuclease VII large subunit [Candidatus Desulfofervidus auxilii]